MNKPVSVPSFHMKPLVRLEKPTIIHSSINFPPVPLQIRKFHDVVNRLQRKNRELVYDPHTQARGKGLQFSADFECGNLGHVYKIGQRSYEIHMLPDPTRQYSALWYFFKVEEIPPGEYYFSIVGFFRNAHLHQSGVQPTMYSENAAKRGIGWQRFGNDMNFWNWKKGPPVEYALSFTFTVVEKDTMYFSYLYPYTYSEMIYFFKKLKRPFYPSILCKSAGGVEVPAIFWDADEGRCVSIQNILGKIPTHEVLKPLIVICARHHPGETCASYAMEGFISYLFGPTQAASRLLKTFSFLILPMMNPDGVICGYYRPTIAGYDMNRVWIRPNKRQHPIEYAVVRLLDELVKNRPLLFLLDFHGHSAQNNAFTYGIWNEKVKLNDYEGLFPRLMARFCTLFDESGSCSLTPDGYASTMRVALHHRYQIPFSYTLEMSFGGIDIGPQSYNQMNPNDYRTVGESVAVSLSNMLILHTPISQITDNYFPPIT